MFLLEAPVVSTSLLSKERHAMGVRPHGMRTFSVVAGIRGMPCLKIKSEAEDRQPAVDGCLKECCTFSGRENSKRYYRGWIDQRECAEDCSKTHHIFVYIYRHYREHTVKSCSPTSGTVTLGKHNGTFSPLKGPFPNTLPYSCLTIRRNSSYMPSFCIFERTKDVTPPNRALTVVILLSHETKAEVAVPSIRVLSEEPYGSRIRAEVTKVQVTVKSQTYSAYAWQRPCCATKRAQQLCRLALYSSLSTE